jgi:histidine triad (HIT) family protein
METAMGCLFCNIINGTTPSKKVFENDRVYSFEDINPQAPVHILVVHKKHIEKIDDLNSGNSSIMSDIFLAVKEIARIKGIDKKGYRVIINNGPAGGQVIWHLHVHVMGGKDDMGPMLAR